MIKIIGLLYENSHLLYIYMVYFSIKCLIFTSKKNKIENIFLEIK